MPLLTYSTVPSFHTPLKHPQHSPVRGPDPPRGLPAGSQRAPSSLVPSRRFKEKARIQPASPASREGVSSSTRLREQFVGTLLRTSTTVNQSSDVQRRTIYYAGSCIRTHHGYHHITISRSTYRNPIYPTSPHHKSLLGWTVQIADYSTIFCNPSHTAILDRGVAVAIVATVALYLTVRIT